MLSAVLALGLAFVMTVVIMPWYIGLVKRLRWGQEIREEGPKDHQSKAGTPTMGGLVLIGAAVLAAICACVLYPPPRLFDTLMVLAAVLAACGIGFIDDFAKVRNKRNLGLKARHKLILQGSLGLAMAAYVVFCTPSGGVIYLPALAPIYAPLVAALLVVCVMVATTNAVNLTDGLDGLAAGTVTAAAAAYLAIALLAGRSELAIPAAALMGGCLGFLVFNRYPARIFMGDTGSLALGAGLAALASLTRVEWLLMIIGGVFVAEAVSVMLQVAYFKRTGGKRIFRMSPIHHHFCLGGLHETVVTQRFWLVGVFLAVLGLALWYPNRDVWPI